MGIHFCRNFINLAVYCRVTILNRILVLSNRIARVHSA